MAQAKIGKAHKNHKLKRLWLVLLLAALLVFINSMITTVYALENVTYLDENGNQQTQPIDVNNKLSNISNVSYDTEFGVDKVDGVYSKNENKTVTTRVTNRQNWGDPKNADKNTVTWYYVEGNVTIETGVACWGDVRLILKDGATLTVNNGIQVSHGKNEDMTAEGNTNKNSPDDNVFNPQGESVTARLAEFNYDHEDSNKLTVYAQSSRRSENVGKLIANGMNTSDKVNANGTGQAHNINTPGKNWGSAGIGGIYEYNFKANELDESGNVKLDKDGKVVTYLVGDRQSHSGTINIYGGNITARGGLGSAGIGSSLRGQAGPITIKNATVNARGYWWAAGIGGGDIATYSKIDIVNSNVTATGDALATGIGSGGNGNKTGTNAGFIVGGPITIDNSKILATGGTRVAQDGGETEGVKVAPDIGDGGSYVKDYIGTSGTPITPAASVTVTGNSIVEGRIQATSGVGSPDTEDRDNDGDTTEIVYPSTFNLQNGFYYDPDNGVGTVKGDFELVFDYAIPTRKVQELGADKKPIIVEYPSTFTTLEGSTLTVSAGHTLDMTNADFTFTDGSIILVEAGAELALRGEDQDEIAAKTTKYLDENQQKCSIIGATVIGGLTKTSITGATVLDDYKKNNDYYFGVSDSMLASGQEAGGNKRGKATVTEYVLGETTTTVDENGRNQDQPLTRWYVFKGTVNVTDHRLTVRGDVHIILENGANYTFEKGIYVADRRQNANRDDNITQANSVTFYSQKIDKGLGRITAIGQRREILAVQGDEAGVANNIYDFPLFGAAIGDIYHDYANSGTITINGGEFYCYGGTSSTAIGGNSGQGSWEEGDKSSSEDIMYNAAGDIIINGGWVNAYAGNWSAGIGGSDGNNVGNITINGGHVYAYGHGGGAGIGGGGNGTKIVNKGGGGNITITGGKVTAIGGNASGTGYTSGDWFASDIGKGYQGLKANTQLSEYETNVNITGGIIICSGRFAEATTFSNCIVFVGELVEQISGVTLASGTLYNGKVKYYYYTIEVDVTNKEGVTQKVDRRVYVNKSVVQDPNGSPYFVVDGVNKPLTVEERETGTVNTENLTLSYVLSNVVNCRGTLKTDSSGVVTVDVPVNNIGAHNALKDSTAVLVVQSGQTLKTKDYYVPDVDVENKSADMWLQYHGKIYVQKGGSVDERTKQSNSDANSQYLEFWQKAYYEVTNDNLEDVSISADAEGAMVNYTMQERTFDERGLPSGWQNEGSARTYIMQKAKVTVTNGANADGYLTVYYNGLPTDPAMSSGNGLGKEFAMPGAPVVLTGNRTAYSVTSSVEAGKHYDPILSGKKEVVADKNNEFTVRFKFAYVYNGVKFKFGDNNYLPVGTKLVLLELDELGNAKEAFAYTVTENSPLPLSELPIIEFENMSGARIKFSNEEAKLDAIYQLCVQLPLSAQKVDYYVTAAPDGISPSTVKVTVNGDEYGVALSNVTAGVQQFTATVNVSNPPANALLAVTLDHEVHSDLMSVTLVNEDGVDMQTVTVTRDNAVFKGIEAGKYTLTVRNLAPVASEECVVTVSLCKEPNEEKYPMQHVVATVSSGRIHVSARNAVKVTATLVNGAESATDRVVLFGQESAYALTVQCLGLGELTAVAQKDNGSAYAAYSGFTATIAATETADVYTVSFTVPDTTEVGNYRIAFEYGGATHYFYFVVVDFSE